MARHRSSSGGHQGTLMHVGRGERVCSACRIPSSTEGTGSSLQPRLPPLPGNLTAMSEADNVRGQEATHLKLYLECKTEA